MTHRTAEEMADITIEIYNSEFRGKSKGRFALTREQIKDISGRITLKDSIIEQLIDELYERGYCMIYVDGIVYSIMKQSILANFRKPTKSVLTKITNKYKA
ncbi:hypothetical protein DS893_00020 [Vibrionales bacterium C3R12]|uniref:hypothetical protein n=1 Tax=Vibrio sp. 03-59-1 TaxID=2607607 RepID=UPI000DEB17C8|nr:hypothetical protein [Vibrio sp. 03-59-1]NOH86028.1 hypothetical protein [Vibrio sp. 03-59-1]RBW67246.1 hypothetical protein DS893_00020 [Vibrionales bacterium C3R12]